MITTSFLCCYCGWCCYSVFLKHPNSFSRETLVLYLGFVDYWKHSMTLISKGKWNRMYMNKHHEPHFQPTHYIWWVTIQIANGFPCTRWSDLDIPSFRGDVNFGPSLLGLHKEWAWIFTVCLSRILQADTWLRLKCLACGPEFFSQETYLSWQMHL